MLFVFERFRLAGYRKCLDFMPDRQWHGNKHAPQGDSTLQVSETVKNLNKKNERAPYE